ncbi:MAG: hypothetical protein ACK5WD_03690 [bacterium]
MDSPRHKPARGARLSKRSLPDETRETPVSRVAPVRRVELLGAFRDECESAIAAIRHAVQSLSDAVGVDPLKPQEVSRRLKLNKNLTWKFARILIEEDALDAAPMLPGPEGVAIYLRAFEAAGVPIALVQRLRDALADFDQMVNRHFGGRADFELVLDGLRSGANLEQSRRLAFRGAAGVFGVQAAARVTAQIISPSGNSAENADLTMLVGLVGLRRLRPIAKLPVFRSLISTANAPASARPLLSGPLDGPPDFLLREFSSFPEASVTRAEADGKLTISLDNGPIGRIGEADLFFASVLERSYARRSDGRDDGFSQFITAITIPSEHLVSDLFVHRSIDCTDSLDAAIFGTLGGPVPHDAATREPTRIPIDCTPTISDDLAADERTKILEVATVPNYVPMIERAFAALGQDPCNYRLIRVAMAYPPVPASLVVRWRTPR